MKKPVHKPLKSQSVPWEDEKHSNATEQLKASSSATDDEASQAADTPNSEAADAPTSASDADSDSDHSDAPDERDK